jgi:Family of unknown function (DUF5678)
LRAAFQKGVIAMSTITAENLLVEKILHQVKQLPRATQLKLAHLIETAPSPAPKAPLDKRVPAQPIPDDTRERAWVKAHKHEYAGQWVALDGDRLIAASPNRAEISAAVKADSAPLPLILRIPSPDDLPPIGI